MSLPEWLLPWVIAGLAVVPVIETKRWIHTHIQGLGLVLTDNERAAVFIYYLSMAPGVILHETSQFLLATALRVPVKKFRIWPEEEQSGDVRLGLVEIEQDKAGWVRSSLIGMVPLVVGVLVIALIEGARFNEEALFTALPTWELGLIWQGFRVLLASPDFWLWFYLIFAIANTMFPEPHDEINWLLPVGALTAFAAVLFVLDLGILVQAGLEGPLAAFGRWLSIAFVSTLLINLFVMALIAAAEALASRLLQREAEYG